MFKAIIDSILSFLRSFRHKGPAAATADMTAEFGARYKAFRSLLTANNNALELMAEMEQTLSSGRPFGMTYVRGRCTALTVNVYKMVKCLGDLSGGRYRDLERAFGTISPAIEAVLARQPGVATGKQVLDMSEISSGDVDLAGDKMANLGEVGNRAGLDVPDGFVITAAATHLFFKTGGLMDEVNRRLTALDPEDLESLYTVSASIQQLIAKAPVPPELEASIMEHHARLREKWGEEVLVSMRSSAVGEDRKNLSFAGQYRTQLNVGRDFVLQTFKEIVAGKYSSQAISYRIQRGFRHQDDIICVGCLVMVEAAVSGVAFSRPPEDMGAECVDIYAARGLGSRVVEGSAREDFYRVNREDENALVEKRPAEGAAPVLSDAQAREVALAAIRLEAHFGGPQDIEWSTDKQGRLFILQSRPLRQSEAPGESVHPEDESAGKGVLLRGGLTASRGAASGPVHIVRNNVDMLEFPKGAVLVVQYPLPEWATLMGRASAVIAEAGHAATHLAIVAREFGVPALFGMSGAADRLENGMVVTVDAARRRVYAGRHEEALSVVLPRPDLMAGSPIRKILAEAMEKVLPLNLTDPGSPFFRPSHCVTLHDITRFCHEKAVAEMFSFGASAGFDDRSAKQLVGETPYQWWVINLDDGFSERFDTRGRFVSMEDIVSTPMKAIWEGMTSKPWAGPPPVDLKGFGSILFRSTMNPSLDPAVRSAMTSKNYFLISGNFCNLSMRLGYHFTLVEAYLGDLLTENYVTFQFKGGAADKERRYIRVGLIKDVLELMGFRVEIKLDALTARIEKKPPEYLLKRLRGLGYLLIHTRQIDMVMGESHMVDHYRRSITEDLTDLFGLAAESQSG